MLTYAVADGGFMYSTTDLAAIRQRITKEHAERVLYVTDAGQASHFTQVFQVTAPYGQYLYFCTSKASKPGQASHLTQVFQVARRGYSSQMPSASMFYYLLY